MRDQARVYRYGGIGGAQPASAATTIAVTAADQLRQIGAVTIPTMQRSLALLVPGTGQLVTGRLSVGLFFMCSIGFSLALARAVLISLDRLAATLPLLDVSMAACFWTLVGSYVCLVVLHVAGTLNGVGRGCEPIALHPTIPAAASAVLPGWGQLLNGNRVRAGICLAGVWIVGGVWLLSSAPATALINRIFPRVGSMEQLLREPLLVWSLQWTVPAVVWCLAVYDATQCALSRRRKAVAEGLAAEL